MLFVLAARFSWLARKPPTWMMSAHVASSAFASLRLIMMFRPRPRFRDSSSIRFSKRILEISSSTINISDERVAM